MNKEEIIEKIKKYLNGDSLYDTELDFLIEELTKKYQLDESIIDKMSEKLTSPVNDKEWVKEYYRKEVEKEWKENLNL